MSDFIGSVKAIFYERAVSPLFGTFAAAWLVCNYKFFLILFSDMSADGKIIYIEYVLYPDSWRFLPLLLFPMVGTFLALFVYPILAEPVYKHVVGKRAALKKIKQDGDASILDEKILKMQRLLSEQRIEAQREYGFRDEDIERLKKVVDELNRENASLKEAHPKGSIDMTPVEIPSLKDLVKSEKSESQILSPTQLKLLLSVSLQVSMQERIFFNAVSKEDGVRVRYDINTLIAHGLISRDVKRAPNREAMHYLSITPKGTQYVIENKLLEK